MVQRLGLGRTQALGGVRLGTGQLVVLDFGCIGLQGLALLFAIGVDVGVRQDPVEPGLEISAGLVLVEGCERLGERLLDEVLGVGRVARRPKRCAVELVQERHRLSLEPRDPLSRRLSAHVNDRLVKDRLHDNRLDNDRLDAHRLVLRVGGVPHAWGGLLVRGHQ